MNKKVIGIIMAVLGVVLAGAGYTFRPPSNFSDMMMMASQGRNFYLQPPVYLATLIGGALLLAGGIWNIVKANKEA